MVVRVEIKSTLPTMSSSRKIEEITHIMSAYVRVRESGVTNMFDTRRVSFEMNNILSGTDIVTKSEVESMIMRFMSDDTLYNRCCELAGE